MRNQAGPVTEISGFATEISVTGMKISHMNTPARVTGTQRFTRNSFAFAT